MIGIFYFVLKILWRNILKIPGPFFTMNIQRYSLLLGVKLFLSFFFSFIQRVDMPETLFFFLQKFELRNHKTYIFRRKIFEILLLSFVSFFFSREKLCFLTFIGEDIARLRFSLLFYALTVVSS